MIALRRTFVSNAPTTAIGVMEFIKTHRTWLAFLAKAVASAALVWWLLGDIDMAATTTRMAAFSVGGVAAVFAVLALQVPLVTWRWSLISQGLGRPLRFGDLLGALLVGLFFNQTLPSTVGGDGIRIWRAYRLGQPLKAAVGGVLIDRGVALLANLAIIAIGLPWFLIAITAGPAGQALALITLLGLAAAAIALGYGEIPRFLSRIAPLAAIAALLADARRIFAEPRRAALLLLVGVAVHFCSALSVFVLAWDSDLPLSLINCVLLVPPVILVSVLPISIAGWGLRETAMVSAFGFIGLPSADALALSIAYGLANLVIGLPGGAIWLLTGRPRPQPGFDTPPVA